MPDRLEPGDPERIGDFWLSGRLGAGGQGVVYDAYGSDGVRVAVKVLHGAQESPDELARMAAEARAAQRVASFCTAKILQVRLEPPRPYIVSEYIDGLSLQAVVGGTGDRDGRRFGGDDLHRLGIGIVTALAAIHQAKVVHRDLKPANVLMGPDGPRLIDFGIARMLDSPSVTQSGFAGTLRYMAPEVYGGQRAGAEADVFAWGAIMVFAATGEHAFKGGTMPVIANQVRGHHPDLSALPDQLRPLVAAALAKDPLARPSARTILAALTGDPRQGAGDLGDLVAAGAAQAGPHDRWEPGDPALGKLAEDAYAGLPPAEQSLVPEVFLRCVVPGEDGSLATRPVAAAELFDRADPAEAHALGQVVDAFRPLLAVTGDREQVVLTRPAVLRAWPRLRGWVEAEREGLGARHRIRQAARTWAEHGRRRGDVLTGADLDEAVRWATSTDRGHALNRLERGLLDASTRARTARGRRVRAVAAVLAVTTVLSLAATGWAVRAQSSTERQRDIAAARQLAAQSRQFGGTAPDMAALLAVAAHGIRETPESRAALKTIATKAARGVLGGYRGNPGSLAADRAGRLLAMGNEDGTVALWDVRRNRQDGGFLQFAGEFPSVALSPDGRTLAAAMTDVVGGKSKGAVRLWDVRTRRPLGDLPTGPDPGSVGPDRTAVVFTADGTGVAVDNGDGVGFWDVRTLRRRGPALPHPAAGEAGTSIVIGPGATTAAMGHRTFDESTVRLWDLATRRPQASFPVEGDPVALSPDGKTLVTKDDLHGTNNKVYLWDASTGRRRAGPITLSHGDGDVGPFSPDGRVVVIGTQLWEAATGTRVGAISTDIGGELTVEAFVGRGTVASLSGDGTTSKVRLWDVSVHQPDHHPFTVGRSTETRVQGSSPDGRTLVVLDNLSAGPSTLRTWDVATGRETRPPIPVPAEVVETTGVAWIVVAGDGKTFATGNEHAQVRLWDATARRWFALESDGQSDVSSMAFSPDGRVLAIGGSGNAAAGTPTAGRVELWDVRKRTLISRKPLLTSKTNVRALAFSSDGKTLATGLDQTVRLWDVSTGKEKGSPIHSPVGTVDVLAFAPNGRTLALGGAKSAMLWDVGERHQIGGPLTGHSGDVTALGFSRDGGTLATGGDDQTVKLWDTASQTQVGAPLVGHSGPVASLTFSADASSLLTSDDTATVRRWNIAMPADPAATACAIAGRTMTRAEWAQYVPPGIGYRDLCPSRR